MKHSNHHGRTPKDLTWSAGSVFTDIFPEVLQLTDRELQKQDILIAEGRLVAERVVRTCEPLGILCVPSLEPEAARLVSGRCPILVKPESEIAALAGYPFHRGLLLLARRPRVQRFLDAAGCAKEPLDEMKFRARDCIEGARRLVVLPALSDAENLGAVIRSAAVLGWDGIVLGPASCDPYSRRVLRCSMAAVLSLPLFRYEQEAELDLLSNRGWELWAAALRPGAAGPEALQEVEKLALLLGNEYWGLSAELQNRCRNTVMIPQ
ncbi:MAG: RNA methyltransferase, partial [Termitinemataceae bacterium]